MYGEGEVSGSLVASSCIGCPTSSGHGPVIALAIVLVLAGAIGWVVLARAQAVLGRLVGGLLIAIGLVLLVAQP